MDCWNGLLERTAGMDCWNGLLEWTTGMDYWNGLLEWTTGMDYWNDIFFALKITLMAYNKVFSLKEKLFFSAKNGQSSSPFQTANTRSNLLSSYDQL